jgi:hypothetical protein
MRAARINADAAFNLPNRVIMAKNPYCSYVQPAKNIGTKTLAQELWITLHNPCYFFLNCVKLRKSGG